jgi:hypothetical protein
MKKSYKIDMEMNMEMNTRENINFDKNSIQYKLINLCKNLDNLDNKVIKYNDNNNKDIDISSKTNNFNKNILNDKKQ